MVLQELWTYQGFFLVAFKFYTFGSWFHYNHWVKVVTYTFGSRFTYKRWVRVLLKIWILAFLGKYSNIVCWVSKRVNWSSHHILICLLGLNACLLSFASDTIMASFRAQIGWKRSRKCENKSYHSVSFLPDSKYKIRKK